jgi:hypothetical protein
LEFNIYLLVAPNPAQLSTLNSQRIFNPQPLLRGEILPSRLQFKEIFWRHQNPPESIPADSELPEAPEDVSVVPAASGHLLARWSAAPRADRYNVYKQVVGVNEDYVMATTVTDTAVDLNTFTPGMHVKVRLAAVNQAGESEFSEEIDQVVM